MKVFIHWVSFEKVANNMTVWTWSVVFFINFVFVGGSSIFSVAILEEK